MAKGVDSTLYHDREDGEGGEGAAGGDGVDVGESKRGGVQCQSVRVSGCKGVGGRVR